MEQNLCYVVEERSRKGIVIEIEIEITGEMTTGHQVGFQVCFCCYCWEEEAKRVVSVDSSSDETVTAENSLMNWKMYCYAEAVACSCFHLLDVERARVQDLVIPDDSMHLEGNLRLGIWVNPGVGMNS